jgi:hypothetical protein
MQPRIYTYKITFEEVPYYYHGSKKEKYFNEEYWGSPVTNKWCWELYTPKKQILELFDYTDGGYKECRKVEDRLIKPVLNDCWCLNESCGGNYSLEICRINGKNNVENKIGIFALSSEDLSKLGKKGGSIGGPKGARTQIENKIGMYARSEEQRKLDCIKGGKVAGKKLYEEGKGIFSLSLEERFENCKKGGEIMGQRTKELGVGIHKLTKEERAENGRKYGGIGGKVVAEKYSRSFSLISPTGERVDVTNLTKFCRDNNLNRANLQSVLRGNRNHHGGWSKCNL